MRIADDGPGIAAADLAHIFEPRFTRRADNLGAGAGLGLPITRGIAERWGGAIDAESVPGQGATFLVRLPIVCES